MSKYSALFEDEDDVFLGSPVSKLMDIIFNANNDVVRFDLENFIRRRAALEMVLDEKLGEDYGDIIDRFIVENRDAVESKTKSLSIELMGEIIKTIKDRSNKSMTSVKIRLGFEKKNHLEIAKVVEDSGADFIAVHGRTRAGKFQSEVDYDAIAEIKDALSIPVIANGDIDSYEKAQQVLAHTHCDGVMIGRGAVGSPWIFHQLKHKQSEIDLALKHQVIMEHFDKMVEFYGEYGVILFRKHTHTYSKGYKGASMLRNRVNSIGDVLEYREVIDQFFKTAELAI